jgi:hypothetical protein
VSRADRGSALMLLPAGVLVVLVLASIAVDMALVQLRQRQAFDLAASAANDAATAGVAPGSVRAGAYVLDPALATASVERSVAASQLAPDLSGAPAVRVTPDTVEVTVTLTADYLFAGVIPGSADGTTVTATASATASAGLPGG